MQDSDYVVIFAYESGYNEENEEYFKIMQTYARDGAKPLKAVHDTSWQVIGGPCADYKHKVGCENLARCHDPAPTYMPSLSLPLVEGLVSVDMLLCERGPKAVQDHIIATNQSGKADITDHGSENQLRVQYMYKFASVNNIPRGSNHSSAEPHPEVPQNDLTPSTSVISHAYMKGYSVLLSSVCGINRRIGISEIFSFRSLLHADAEVLTIREPPNDPTQFKRRLSVRKGDITYEILGYPRDDIGSLCNDVLDTGKLLKIHCVYSI